MSGACFKCGNQIDLGPGRRIARGDSCDKCRADLHVCLNCKFYDRAAYNQCRESQAERVLDKDRANFCDYFELREGGAKDAGNERAAALKKLDELFK